MSQIRNTTRARWRSLKQAGHRSGHRVGFTMVELLVTIGILVVVTAGVATIFNSIGGTVARGRKLSELNRFAGRLERVMREDFDSMTRDGFLVIVNKNANFGNDVKLFRGERSNIDETLAGGFSSGFGRIRRNDEIMFFARGDFETSRRAISPSMIARSHEAAIYYGLGQKRRPQISASDPGYDDPSNFFFNPKPWDTNYDLVLEAQLGVNTPGYVNPNEFARDWTLLRQVTLLAPPSGAGQVVPTVLFGLDRDDPAQRRYLQDSDRQIALQPAGRSIFTSLSGTDPSLSAAEFPRWLYDISPEGQPNSPSYRVSGEVDIVTQDLATIRNMVQALPYSTDPNSYFNYAPMQPQPIGGDPVTTDFDTFGANFWETPASPPRPLDALGINLGQENLARTAWTAPDPTQATRIRKWMIDALPSRWNLNTDNPRFISGVRYEDIPTRMLFNDDDFNTGTQDQQDISRIYAEANQEMLGASVFVPRCTEFIVEWSYGFVDNTITNPLSPDYKKMLWYGLDRTIDTNNDGLLDPSEGFAARHYSPRSDTQAGKDARNNQREPGMSPLLIVGHNALAPGAVLSPDDVEIATFGFTTKNAPSGYTVDWVWPKYIRITMSLADPTDQEIEQTYQVVFEVPDDRRQ